MPHYSVKPIQLVLQPSYFQAALLAVVGLGACLIVGCMPMLVSLKLFVCVLIVLATTYFIAQEALLCLPWSCTGLALNSKGELSVTRRDGVERATTVLHTSFVAAYLTILNLKVGSSRWRRNLILTPDRVDSLAFRHLRVWLRWGRQAVPDDALEEA